MGDTKTKKTIEGELHSVEDYAKNLLLAQARDRAVSATDGARSVHSLAVAAFQLDIKWYGNQDKFSPMSEAVPRLRSALRLR